MLNIFDHKRNANQNYIEKKCSPSLAIKEMQIKTTLRFYLTPVKVTRIKNTTKNKFWRGWGWVGRNPHSLLVGM
jgi:hypothetical protein